jgi:hypothetical protein
MRTDRKTIVQKAELALGELTTAGGVLQPIQAKKFMVKMIEEAKLLGLVTFKPMGGPIEYIDQVTFGGRILQRGTVGEALAEAARSKPNLDRVELNAKLLRGEIPIPSEVFEDNIEKAGFLDTLRNLLAIRCKRDLELLVVRGDTALTGEVGSDNDYLRTLDGILKQATTHQTDATDNYISKTIMRDALKAMPEQWKQDKETLRFFTSTDVETHWRDIMGDRATILGDRVLENDVPVPYSGVPVVNIGTFPQNVGTGSHCANIILTDPKNIHVGVCRDIKIKMGEDIRADVVLMVVSMRVDVKYLIEDAVVKVSNVKV